VIVLSTFLLSLQLLLSVRDVNDALVMLSLNALATLVPLLGGDVVIGSGRHQLFSRGQPKVIVYYVYIADSSLDCFTLFTLVYCLALYYYLHRCFLSLNAFLG